MTTILLQTKLYVPPTRSDLVSRPSLIGRLSAGLDGNFTLVSAPAGFGKTTLLSQWTANLDRPVAWVSLDRGDNDYIRFWSHVIAALQSVYANLGDAALSALNTPQHQGPSTEAMLIGLINEIIEVDDGPFVLILDDYHLIQDRQVNDSVAFLVEYAPLQMHVILSGRADPPWPLARMRARRQMNELRSKDLRFSLKEAAAFLNDVMGLDLSAEDIAALDSQTEGWVAGLQMAALSMQDREDVTGFIKSFSSSHRFILDYLVEEVLERCPAGTRDFLIKTSILERMTASLCDAITDRKDSALVLTELEQANLFLVPLDDERRWYRYHHLFGDLLNGRLEQGQSETKAVLHCRASEWYEDNGFLAEAMSHASAAGDAERQVQLIAENVLTMAYLGELTTLVRWLDAMPADAGRDQPWFHVSRAWVLVFAGRLDDVEAHLRAAEKPLSVVPTVGENSESDPATDHIAGHIAAIRGYVAGLRGDPKVSIDYVRQALEILPEQDAMARGWTTLLLAVILRAQGDLDEADQAFSEAANISKTAGIVPLAVDVLWEHCVLALMQGRLHWIFSTCQEAQQLAASYVEQGGRRLPPAGYTHIGISLILQEWNDLEAALEHAKEATRLCKRWGMADAIVRSHVHLAQLLQLLGDASGAQNVLKEAGRVADTMSPMYQGIVAMFSTRIDITLGKLSEAERWAGDQGIRVDDDITYQQVTMYTIFARLLIAQGGASLHGVLTVLESLQAVVKSAGATGNLIEVLVLKAIASQALGEETAALQALGDALLLGEPEGYTRMFLDEGAPMGMLLRKTGGLGYTSEYVSRLLGALESELGTEPEMSVVGQPIVDQGQPMVEPLTERESEVLRLLKTSLSATEIANELVVAPSTVRSHIKSIYGKLGVHRRMEAVVRAEALGLI